MLKWYEQTGDNKDVVISSRVRLARNLDKYPFAIRMKNETSENLIKDVQEGFFSQSDSAKSFYEFLEINKLPEIDKIAMMERHVISPLLIKKEELTGLILSKDESMSVMINEEDHIRIQAIAPGMSMAQAWEHANRIDDLLEEKLSYAYSERFGYLTSCPTNIGTGLRASYMLHVPALESTGKLQIILDAMAKFGITIRGIYGEGTQGEGSVFQISNQKTLGQSEQEIIENLNSVVSQIVEQERKIRENLLKDDRSQIEDAVYRSYGLLRYARKMTSKDAMSLLSDVKLGLELGLLRLEDEKPFNVYELMMVIQPANIQKNSSKNLDVADRDTMRATFIREHLPQIQ